MRKIILVILVVNLTSCKGQIKKNENSLIKKDSMEYFDINNYKNLEVDEKYSPSSRDLYFKDDKRRIQILYFHETIQIEETSIENKFQTIKVFYESNKSLKIKGQRFYSFPINKWEFYDENGNYKKDIDYNLEFKITVDDLSKIMKEKYNVDIMDVNKTDLINRYVDLQKTKLSLYEVYYRDQTKQGILNCYIINGNTGEVLYTTTRFADTEEKQGSLYEKFIKSLK